MLVSLLAPALSPELVEKLRAAGVTAMAMDAVPRISRAQSLDVLSSMANIAGYRAVVEAAHEFGSFFTGQVTAAGKVPPAKVLVAGAGVAGLAAIGTARSLGAIVRATDARAEVAEQVESMGAEFLAVQMPEVEAGAASSDGYAKEMGEEYNRRAAELYAEQAPDADIIVTTALIPGRPAPRLITGEMVAAMKPGSVIVDMAASNGGNVEGSVADEMVVTAERGADHRLHRPRRAAPDPGLAALRHQPRQPHEAADPRQGRGAGAGLRRRRAAHHDRRPRRRAALAASRDPGVGRAGCRRRGIDTGGQGARQAQGPEAQVRGDGDRGRRSSRSSPPSHPPSFLGHFTVFALAVVIGYYVIGNVHHALHTPLMSVTNAISGIIVVGALLQLGTTSTSGGASSTVILVLAFIATLIASINIFGGFTVTRRMLTMFRKG